MVGDHQHPAPSSSVDEPLYPAGGPADVVPIRRRPHRPLPSCRAFIEAVVFVGTQQVHPDQPARVVAHAGLGVPHQHLVSAGIPGARHAENASPPARHNVHQEHRVTGQVAVVERGDALTEAHLAAQVGIAQPRLHRHVCAQAPLVGGQTRPATGHGPTGTMVLRQPRPQRRHGGQRPRCRTDGGSRGASLQVQQLQQAAVGAHSVDGDQQRTRAVHGGSRPHLGSGQRHQQTTENTDP